MGQRRTCCGRSRSSCCLVRSLPTLPFPHHTSCAHILSFRPQFACCLSNSLSCPHPFQPRTACWRRSRSDRNWGDGRSQARQIYNKRSLKKGGRQNRWDSGRTGC